MSATIDLEFDSLHSTVEDSSMGWQLLLRIDGVLRITIGGNVFFAQPMFPVVELAAYASGWLRLPDQDFAYVSLEAEEDPLIAFHLTGDRYRGYSPWAKSTDLPLIKRNELISAFQKFVDQVESRGRRSWIWMSRLFLRTKPFYRACMPRHIAAGEHTADLGVVFTPPGSPSSGPCRAPKT